MISVHDRLRHAVGVHTAAVTVPGEAPAGGRGADPGAATASAGQRHRIAADVLALLLRGDWHETTHGPVFVRDDWYPLDHRHGNATLGFALDIAPAAVELLATGGGVPHPSRLAFFDIETTGLSGGTGTYMVLAGLGSYEAAVRGEPLAFRMRQYFLADIAHEYAMLDMLVADLARFEGIVTYNGRAFDVPFVETRLTLARLRSPVAGMPHLDLLHPLRRLYKHRMPACRLADAERRLLRIDRPDDVPGSLIPQIYFDYLRAGRINPLRGVFRHNAEDVLSLVGVLAGLARLLTADALDPDDAAAVARWWENRGDEARAAVLWWKLWDAGDRAAGLELAKHLEHHARDHEAAQAVAGALRALASPAEAPLLDHRLARLEAKLRRASTAVVGQCTRAVHRAD
jgi:uncharacterized protein YprB with RNaseH-like and TPR domain